MNIKNNKYILILLISFFSVSIISFFIPLQFLINFAHDDSFFYLKIAQNIVNGSGVTFDNISSTNGFHPLYLIIISILFFLLKIIGISSSAQQYLAVFILHIFLIHLIVLIIYRLFRNILSEEYKKYGILVFILFCSSFIFIRDFGLESHVSCILIALYLLISLKIKNQEKIRYYNVFILCGLFLSRTDYLFTLIPFLIFSDYFLNFKEKRIATLIYNISGVIIITIIYYLGNYIFWGNFQTTSSLMVSTFPKNIFFENLNRILTWNYKLYNQGMRSFIFLFVFTLFIFKKNKDKLDFSLIFLSLGLIANSLLHLNYNVHGIREWYMTLPTMISGVMIVLLLEEYNKRIRYLTLMILAMLFSVTFYYSRFVALKWDYAYDYALFLKNNTEKMDRIYQYDMSGIVSYFSDRDVINGDGLVNDFNYINYLKNNDIGTYLKINNVKYLSTINYSEDLFSEDGLYKFRSEESPLSNIILKEENLFHKYTLVYKHVTGYYYGYFLLFRL